MLSPKEITEKTFDKTFGFGYRMDDVDVYLKQAAASLTEQLEINADLEKKLEVLADKLTEYREDEESLRTALLGAQKLGDSVIRESKTKAEIIMRDATIKAEAMVNNAKRQIEREQESLAMIQKEVATFKNRLLDLYKQHLELISALPGNTTKAEEPQQEDINVTPEPPEEVVPAPEPEIAAPVIMVQESAEQAAFFDADLDEDDDDEPEQIDAQEGSQKFGELRFGEAFKLKRENGFSKFKK